MALLLPVNSGGLFEKVYIIGSGIAGLLAAKVCSAFASRVIVLERDKFEQMGGFRPGVPQARHLHSVTVQGLRYLELLFPGFYETAVKAGALPFNLRDNLEYLSPCSTVDQNHPGLAEMKFLGISRLKLENLIRSEVSSIPNINLRYGTRVTGMQITSGKIASVQILSDNIRETLDTEFVIDCSGRSSPIDGWLASAQWSVPTKAIVDGQWTYLSQFFSLDLPQDAVKSRKFRYYDITRDKNFGGALLPLEDNRYVATIIQKRAKGSLQLNDVVEYSALLRNKRIYEIISIADPVSSVAVFKKTESVRKLIRKKGLPLGLLIMGDSLCALNPKYGQGITIAAKTALILRETLDSLVPRRTPFDKDIQDKIQESFGHAAEDAWSIAALTDLQLDGTCSENIDSVLPLQGRLSQEYMQILYRLAKNDPEVTLYLLQVIHLMRKPLDLLGFPLLVKIAKDKFLA
jgi:2-polyprenyl-6-methoxyphenol hydroxylase-like FAD-dependent oxidoreductase